MKLEATPSDAALGVGAAATGTERRCCTEGLNGGGSHSSEAPDLTVLGAWDRAAWRRGRRKPRRSDQLVVGEAKGATKEAGCTQEAVKVDIVPVCSVRTFLSA